MANSVFLPLAPARVLAQAGGTWSVSATTAEEIIATILVPAGALGSAGRIVIDTTFEFTASTNQKKVRLRAGAVGDGLSGTAFQEFSTVSGTAVVAHFAGGMQAITASSQVGLQNENTVNWYSVSTVAPAALTLDSSAVIEIVITGEKASAGETLSMRAYQVLLTVVG